MEPERTYGLTPPISLSLPTESEKQYNEALLKELHGQGTFESAAETQKRHQVLASLQKITDAFVKKVATEKEPNNPVLIRDARGKIFTYGSFRLGVYGPGSDIDTLVVAPRYVSREDYFKYFPDLLREMAPAGAIDGLTVVTDAFVPIIKFEFSGISIDLIFSRIATLKQLPADPKWNLKENNLLRGLDDGELRSLNGTRVTDDIVTLVPEPTTFRLALRAIKLWAQRRAIYANIMGFPGGVAWAMLVARVCQLYPKAAGALIVNKFFHIMRRWPWPQPVLLKSVEEGPLQVRVWNPKIYKGDQYHLMPIITPAYPSMCATYNITRSAMTVIKQELENGANVTDQIMLGRRPWKDLFVKHSFFTTDFKYYISVTCSSKTKEAHKVWSGFVESKIRVLVQSLERHPNIALARPFNKGYERVHSCKSEADIEQIQNGSLAFLAKETKATDPKAKTEEQLTRVKPEPGTEPETPDPVKKEGIKEEVKSEIKEEAKDQEGEGEINLRDIPLKSEDDTTEVYTTNHYIGLVLAEGAKSLDLSFQVKEFKDLVVGWDKYDWNLNCLSIQHVRNVSLPDDVFEPGEVKPAKPPKKKSQAPNGAAPARKRSASEDNPNPPKRQHTSVAAAAAG